MSESNKNLKVVNMAIAQGQESRESAQFDVYTGVAPMYILAVNPDAKELQSLYPNRDFGDNVPNYIYENKDNGDKGIFVTFYGKVNPEHAIVVDAVNHSDLDLIVRISFLLMDKKNVSEAKQSAQVINAYGETGWVSFDLLKEGKLPEYMVKQSFSTNGLRPAMVGEEALIKFIKAYLNIPNSRDYHRDSNTWVLKSGTKLAEAEASFEPENLKKLLAGNVAQIKSILKYQPKNQVKMLLGAKMTDDNKIYQDVYNRETLKLGVSNYTRLAKEVEDAQNAGAFSNTDFGNNDLKFRKFKVVPTNIVESSGEAKLPFMNDSEDSSENTSMDSNSIWDKFGV